MIGELSHSSVIRQTVNVTAGTKTNLKLDTFGPGDLHAPPVVAFASVAGHWGDVHTFAVFFQGR